jgi:hypothetical protein
MEALHKKYKDRIEELKKMVVESELLETYLDTEEEEVYKQMQEAFEPAINDLHVEVANADPMQLEDFENHMLDEGFEGLFLPRILGYSVLRGDIDNNYKYKNSQEHFKNILLFICNSMNFDYVKLRIGQTVQIGFSLSTNIWVTDLLDGIQNKNIKRFLQTQRSVDFRDLDKRVIAYEAYKKQFVNYNYLSTNFPGDVYELKRMGSHLQKFLLYRAGEDFDNDTLTPYIHTFLKQEDFIFHPEFIRICMVLGMYFDLKKDTAKLLSSIFDKLRKGKEDFENEFFKYYLEFIDDKAHFKRDVVSNFAHILDMKKADELSKFFELMQEVYEKGYVHEDAINAIRNYYNQHMGLSDQNRCLRHALNNRFSKVLSDLSEAEYAEYFELNKIFGLYMDIFANEKFNQAIKYISMDYLKRLLKYYTDKRGKDYQDIKKFVTAAFLEYKFYNDKEISNIFKTRRRSRKETTEK